MVWGADAKSCDALLSRVERNDPALLELFILPTKTFGGAELDRLSRIFEKGSNTNLTSLSASGKNVSEESLFRLGKSIATAAKSENGTALASLAVGDSSLGDEGIDAFCRGVREGGGMTALKVVDFSWKGIGLKGFTDLLEIFGKDCSPKLRSMNLSRNDQIGKNLSRESNNEDGAVVANPDVLGWRHIEELDLSQCDLGDETIAAFFSPLSSVCNELKWKKLRLNQNPIGPRGFNALLSSLVGSSIQGLHMSGCQVGDESMEALASFSPFATQLRIWDISHNNITTKGASLLSRLLATESFSYLVELNLTGNTLGAQGVTELAKSLQSRKQNANLSCVENVDLTDTNCGVEGARAMIRMGNLKSLRLFNNQLGSNGFRDLAVTLRGGHPDLEYLDLGGNGADQAAVVVLLSALLQSPANPSHEPIGCGALRNKLKVLVVGGNEAGEAVEDIVAKIRVVHPALDIARQRVGTQ